MARSGAAIDLTGGELSLGRLAPSAAAATTRCVGKTDTAFALAARRAADASGFSGVTEGGTEAGDVVPSGTADAAATGWPPWEEVVRGAGATTAVARDAAVEAAMGSAAEEACVDNKAAVAAEAISFQCFRFDFNRSIHCSVSQKAENAENDGRTTKSINPV